MDNFEIIIYIIIIIASFAGSFLKKKRQEERRRAQMSRPDQNNEEEFGEIYDKDDEPKEITWDDVVAQLNKKAAEPEPKPNTQQKAETKKKEFSEKFESSPAIGNISSSDVYDQNPDQKYFSDIEDLKRAIISAEILNRKY